MFEKGENLPGGLAIPLILPNEAPSRRQPLSQGSPPQHYLIPLLNTMPQLTKKNVSILNIEPWEEFLDFSRWRTPATSVITKRLIDNALAYSVRLSCPAINCTVYFLRMYKIDFLIFAYLYEHASRATTCGCGS